MGGYYKGLSQDIVEGISICIYQNNQSSTFTFIYENSDFACIIQCILYYHSLYSILDFDWLIHQQTACRYGSAANNWSKYFIEHAHFENASSVSIKNIFLSKCQHGSFCRVIRKRIVHY